MKYHTTIVMCFCVLRHVFNAALNVVVHLFADSAFIECRGSGVLRHSIYSEAWYWRRLYSVLI